jgi:hypothetical protein
VQYQIADRIISTALRLPELKMVSSSHADWHVGEATTPTFTQGVPIQVWTTRAGYRWAVFSKTRDRRHFHFARTALFVIDDRARAVTCHPIGRATVDAWRPVLLNQVLPLLLADERLVLHASAVATPAGALVFVAPPGRGKSTLATALARRGLPLITDDFLVVERRGDESWAIPSGVAPRLWPDSVAAIFSEQGSFPRVGSRASKRRITEGVTVANESMPIRHVFVLAEPQCHQALRPVSGVEAVVALTACTFVSRLDEQARVREVFNAVTTLAARVPIRQLVPVRDFAALDALCDAVSYYACRN